MTAQQFSSDDFSRIQEEVAKHLHTVGACRLFHGRGRRFAGLEWLCIDRFDQVVLITVFAEVDAESLKQLADALAAWVGIDNVILQHRESGQERCHVLRGELPDAITANEEGLCFGIDLARGRNVGFFPDMAQVRHWLRANAAGKNVLNLFAFTCAFSVVAVAGGARQVVNIDLSSPSLETGRRNHQLNGLPTDQVHFFAHNIFRSWKKLHKYGRYDILIVDPPTRQKGSFDADRDYRKVLKQLSKLAAPDAWIVACLNSPFHDVSFLVEAMAASLPDAEFVQRLAAPAVFADREPEHGLKVLLYRYRGRINRCDEQAGEETDAANPASSP